jgi:hypothetical protein
MKGFFRVLWNTGAGIFWLCVVLYVSATSIGMLMATACSRDEVEELYSPNGEYRAYVILSGCGGFSSPSTQVYVERVNNKSLSPFTINKTGQLIRLKGRPDQISYRLSWKSNEEFVISGFDFKKMMAFENQSWGSDLPRVYFEIDGS